MKRTIARSAVRAACAIAAMLAMQASADQALLAKGARRIYRDAVGVEWCVAVIALDTGVDGKPWVWFGYMHDPRHVEHVPSGALGGECTTDAAPAGPSPVKSMPSPRSP